jgi:hypothetical protein
MMEYLAETPQSCQANLSIASSGLGIIWIQRKILLKRPESLGMSM